MANMISTLAILPMACVRAKRYLGCTGIHSGGDIDVHSCIIRTSRSQSREGERSREVSGNRTCPGQSGSDNAYMVRPTIGPDDLWRIRRLYGRKWTPGSSEWPHCQSAHGTSARTVLQATRNRAN